MNRENVFQEKNLKIYEEVFKDKTITLHILQKGAEKKFENLNLSMISKWFLGKIYNHFSLKNKGLLLK